MVGLLGVVTGSRLCYRAYLQYTPAVDTDWADVDGDDAERTWRGNLLRGIPILVGATLLTIHSGRWTLRIFGVL